MPQMVLKAEPQSPPPTNPAVALAQKEGKPFVWPLIGVLANIPLEFKNGRFVGPSGFTLKQHLSERVGFSPLEVEVLCSHRGHSGFALVDFDKDYLKGLEQATMFDNSFQASRCGNLNWNNVFVCPSNKLYGWIAREDDYKFEGIVGQHLRKLRGLKSSVVDARKVEDDGDRKTVLLFSDLSGASSVMHSQVDDGFPLCVDDLLKQKDEMVQRYREDMREAHHSARKHLENIISQRERVKVLLEAQKQEIEKISTELVQGEVLNETELGKFLNEKHMIEKAILEHTKGDDNLVTLAEKHKKQKEKLHRGIIDFEKDVEDKHVLELKIERMRGALKVMRHMRDAVDDQSLEKIYAIHEQLKEKEEQYNRFEAMNQSLYVNEDMQGTTVKELIEYLREGSRSMSIGIRSGRDIDSKPFLNVAKREFSDEKAYEKAMELSSEWTYYLQDPSWNPFVTVEGSIKEEVDRSDARLKCLRKDHSDEE